MRSVVLCEGSDDLWFLGYYFFKKADWKPSAKPKEKWKNYQLQKTTRKQEIRYFTHEEDTVAIWSVGGKDAFKDPVKQILYLIQSFPMDPVNNIVIMQDKDIDPVEVSLHAIERAFPDSLSLTNNHLCPYNVVMEGDPPECSVNISIMASIIPVEEQGALETVLMNAVSQEGTDEEFLVQRANNYIEQIINNPTLEKKYLSHSRSKLKARFSAMIAALNPTHSTAVFSDLMMSHKWEESEYVQKQFDVILKAVMS